jgi:hypothetical protein
LTLAEIQRQVLDEETLLLEYAFGEEESYLWLISQRSLNTYKLPARAEIEAAARRVYKLLSVRPQRGRSFVPQLISQAEDLSRILLGQVAGQLGGKRLIIVAPGTLSYLPSPPCRRRGRRGEREEAISRLLPGMRS